MPRLQAAWDHDPYMACWEGLRMVYLFSIRALIRAAWFYAGKGDLTSARYYLRIIPYRVMERLLGRERW